jgi:hypothetical protein
MLLLLLLQGARVGGVLHDAAGEGSQAVNLAGPNENFWLLLLPLLLLWVRQRRAGEAVG